MVAQCLRFTTGHSIERHGTVCAVSDEPTLAEVIADRKGERSYDRLAADCGGAPSAGRLHQMATKPLKNFPDPDSIRGMASGLGVTVTEIVMASARSLDLNVYTGNDPNAVTIGGAGTLPTSSREVLATVARELIRLTSQTSKDGARHDEITEPRTQEGSTKHGGTGSSQGQPGASNTRAANGGADKVTPFRRRNQGITPDPAMPGAASERKKETTDAPDFEPGL